VLATDTGLSFRIYIFHLQGGKLLSFLIYFCHSYIQLFAVIAYVQGIIVFIFSWYFFFVSAIFFFHVCFQ